MLLPFTEEFSRSPQIREAVSQLANESKQKRGAVFTNHLVVDAILDLVGYTTEQDLSKTKLLEPSFGQGDFLLTIVKRLISSYTAHGGKLEVAHQKLAHAILAVEIHIPSYNKTKTMLEAYLTQEGVAENNAKVLTSSWLIQDDFLLHQLQQDFDFIVGNPPYIRQEKVPSVLLKEYRQHFKTIYDRADLYVPFYEKCLDLLAKNGRLGFICSDRWIKNKYGGPLREKVSSAYHLEYFIDMGKVNAFDQDVMAYPSITIIRNAQGDTTRVATEQGASGDLRKLIKTIKEKVSPKHENFVELSQVTNKRDPWLLDAPDILNVLRHLEGQFPTIEQAQCKVTIGVATGCDRVFIGNYEELPVEQERKLPLAMAGDIKDGELCWSGKGVVNPFTESGVLASLDAYPAFAAYINEHATALKKRHVAKKNPRRWYRTIDRIHTWMTETPKLLIPDIKGDATVAYDEGAFYPHHNLYVLTSQDWDLRALQALLRSSLALMFVGAYSVKMSGGFLRFQAQYLRRIRIPMWKDVPSNIREQLISLSKHTSRPDIDEVVYSLYQLSDRQARKISDFAKTTQVKKAS